ncbi:GumC family protein [candidate division KSB1 bacterium]|nr:GumC family protein [candidate division KSB1 bacterium]NIR68865.1 GumC family protein [candidate division KSB1 bacterium]NIS27233.1 GumC family protein [candidate division KSB1 bacterium]NIT74118.1 GumC family protein [candidate division KSB1 bacterium]NIU27967.1 GumC family protein [candidate division KSB1 bacterium]
MLDSDTHDSVKSQSNSLRNFFTVIFKRKKLILSVFISIVAIITIASFIIPPVYQASSKILVEREGAPEKALLFRMSLPAAGTEGFDWIKSEVEIINSYPVIAQVIKELGLDRDGAESESEETSALRFEKAVRKFRKKFNVESARNSNVIELSYESKDPEQAAEVVRRVLATYQKHRSEIFDESETYSFFEEQMKVADEKLRDLEHRLAEFKNKQEIISPEFQGEILLTKLADYEKSLTAVQTERIGKEAKLSVLMQQIENGNELNIPSTEVSNSLSHEKYIAKLRGELLDMEIKRDRLLQRFKPTYEEVVELENRIAATKKIIRNEVQQIIEQEKTAIRALKAEEQALQKSIAKINENIKKFTEKEYEFSQLSRGIDDNQEVYSMLLKQREEARISLAKLERGVKVKVISPPVVPQKPVKPRKFLNIILGIMLGAMCGLGLAFFLEYNDHSISSVEEMEKMTGLPALGSVREIKSAKVNDRT